MSITIKLPTKGIYSSSVENNPNQIKYVELIEEVREAIRQGTAYAKFIDGDRKGSICKLLFRHDHLVSQKSELKSRAGWGSKIEWNVTNPYIYCRGAWTGKSHKPEVNLPDDSVEILIGYDGPTIWEKFDAKAAKEKILSEVSEKDIDGNVLKVGDRVLFINARYGSGMELDRGTVKEFKVSVDSKRHSIATIIENDEGALSTLNYPSSMVYKLPQ